MIKTGLGLIVISILAGVTPTVFIMVSVFNNAANERSVDASKLSSDISSAMIWTAALMPVAFAGLCILVAGLILAPKHNMPRAEQGAQPDASGAG